MSEWDNFTPRGEGKDLTFPRFYIRPVHNAFKSNKEGRPIFDDVEYVEIRIPGSTRTVVDERVKDEHRQRWPAFYKAFKDGQELAQEGTPLEEWAAITRSQVEELRHFNIRTIETLANLDDSGLKAAVPMGGYALREKARRFLDQAKGAAPADALAAELASMRATMEAKDEQLAALAAEVRILKANRQ